MRAAGFRRRIWQPAEPTPGHSAAPRSTLLGCRVGDVWWRVDGGAREVRVHSSGKASSRVVGRPGEA